MKAGLLTMDYLKGTTETIYTKLIDLARKLRSKLHQLFVILVLMLVTGLGSLIDVHFLNQNEDYKKCNRCSDD
jgi:hypothetical protein